MGKSYCFLKINKLNYKQKNCNKVKDLTLFNDALLAKQAWRLIHNEHSILPGF